MFFFFERNLKNNMHLATLRHIFQNTTFKKGCLMQAGQTKIMCNLTLRSDCTKNIFFFDMNVTLRNIHISKTQTAQEGKGASLNDDDMSLTGTPTSGKEKKKMYKTNLEDEPKPLAPQYNLIRCSLPHII